ncbi:MAG: protein kinase [Planctomycetales bacterium]|nr:protein kinase [Planctomycetales bacterium]
MSDSTTPFSGDESPPMPSSEDWLSDCSPEEVLNLRDVVLSLRSLAGFVWSRESDDRAIPPRVGKYEIIDYVGEGGQAVVWLGYDPHAHRMVIVKRYRAGTFASRRSGVDEARALCSVQHPAIVQCLGIEVDEQAEYLVLQPLSGQSLQQYWEQHAVPPRLAITWLIDIARGLEQLHGIGWVHRDLAPRNLIVTTDRRLVLVDFGLAGPVSDESHDGRTDQSRAHDPSSPRAATSVQDDIQALGRLLRQLVLERRWRPSLSVDRQPHDRALSRAARGTLRRIAGRCERAAARGGWTSAAQFAAALEALLGTEDRRRAMEQWLGAGLALSIAATVPASFVWWYLRQGDGRTDRDLDPNDWSLFVEHWIEQRDPLPPLPRLRQQFPLDARIEPSLIDEFGWQVLPHDATSTLTLRSPVPCEVAIYLLSLSAENAPSIATAPLLGSDRRPLRLEKNQSLKLDLRLPTQGEFEGFLYAIASNGSNSESWRREASSLRLREFGGQWVDTSLPRSAAWQWTSERMVPIRQRVPSRDADE